MKVKMCITCGERYIGDSMYCSDRCREENMRIKAHAQEMLKRKPAKKKIKSELALLNEEARLSGMTYGQYVAKLKSDKERAERSARKEKHGESR